MKKIWVASLAALMLFSGCSKNQEGKTTVCKGKQDEYNVVSFYSEGDKIITQTEQDVYTFEELEMSAEDAKDTEYMDTLLEAYRGLYEDITKGLEISIETDETHVIFKLTLDYTVADFDELAALDIINQGIDYVSLKETIEAFENEDMVCE